MEEKLTFQNLSRRYHQRLVRIRIALVVAASTTSAYCTDTGPPPAELTASSIRSFARAIVLFGLVPIALQLYY